MRVLFACFLAALIVAATAGSAVAPQIACNVRTACLAGEIPVLKLSAATNGHAALEGSGTYGSHICCSAGTIALGTACGTTFLRLSAATNGHVQQQETNTYPKPACLSATGPAVACSYAASCPSGQACIASISAATNAHIGDCNAYTTKVCCGISDSTPPAVQVTYSPIIFKGGETVTITAAASDASGLNYVAIDANGQRQKTCASSPCSVALTYPVGTTVSITATAQDVMGNENTATTGFTVCKLVSALLAPGANCVGSWCPVGSTVTASATYRGTTCPASPHVQIDARSADGTCIIQATQPPGSPSWMNGIDLTCSGTSCSASWPVNSIPIFCNGNWVSASAATLRDAAVSAGGREFDAIPPTGSFGLGSSTPQIGTLSVTPNFVKSGGTVTASTTVTAGMPTKLECGQSPDANGNGYSDNGLLCSGTAATGENVVLSCTFNSPWTDSAAMTFYCKTVRTGTASYSDERSGTVKSDNSPPAVAWNQPAASAFFRDGSTITVDAGITDVLADGTPGSGVSMANCNARIDGSASGFTGTVAYSQATGRCTGTLVLGSPSALADGAHQLSLQTTDALGNTGTSQRQMIMDNTPPAASFAAFPQWTRTSSVNVAWTVADTSTPSNDIDVTVQYALVEPGTAPAGSDWRTLHSGRGVYSVPMTEDNPIKLSDKDGKTIVFRITATDRLGNTLAYGNGPAWPGTTFDFTLPVCSMVTPVFVLGTAASYQNSSGVWFVNGRYNVSWQGTDAISGVNSYDTYMTYGSGVPGNVNTLSYCNNSAPQLQTATSIACGPGASGEMYSFKCRAVDRAGNVGMWSPDVLVKIDKDPPGSSMAELDPWIGRNSMEWLGDNYFRIGWTSSAAEGVAGSGIKCYYAQWKSPSSGWLDLASAGQNCLASPTFEFGRTETGVSEGESYTFRVKAEDNIGNADGWSAGKATTIDWTKPSVTVNITDNLSRPVLRRYISAADVSGISIKSNATDSIAGVRSNVIRRTVDSPELTESVAEVSTPSACLNNDSIASWSAPPYGGYVKCENVISYTEGSTITYEVTATDRAGNMNVTSGFITTHPLSNVLTRFAVLQLGMSIDIPVNIRNIGDYEHNVTVTLGGYGPAHFQPADDIYVLDTAKRSINATVQPGEQKTAYIRVNADEVTQTPIELSLSAISSFGETDSDRAQILVVLPAEFPAFGAAWAFAAMLALAVLAFYRNESPRARR